MAAGPALFVFTLCVLALSRTASSYSGCVMHGVSSDCVPVTFSKQCRPYVNRTEPFPLSFDISDFCPELQAEGYVCCSSGQWEVQKQQLQTAATIFSTCPACFYNFRNFWCQFACSPNQADFVQVTKQERYGNESLDSVVTTLYSVPTKFTQTFWDSCKSVQLSSGAGQAMTFFGSPTNTNKSDCPSQSTSTNSPIGIDYKISDASLMPVEPISCASKGKYECSCENCPSASCSAVKPPKPERPTYLVGHLSDTAFACILVGGLIFSVLLFLFVDPRRLVKAAARVLSVKNGSAGTGGSSAATPISRTVFYRFGELAAQRPLWLIFLGLALAGGAAVGVRNIEIETDPVKLWVKQSSRSASNKQYYDSHFGGFYRIEQVIIRRSTGGSVFNNATLQQTLRVEKAILSIVADNNGSSVQLQDICAVAAPGHGCTYFSPLGFWQSNSSTISMSAAAGQLVTHLKSCIKQPAASTCEDATGLPIVNPNVIFGWSGSGSYEDATALVLTFLVRADCNINAAEAWEDAFLNVVQRDWEGLDLAYNAQISVEAELSREGSADVPNIVASYCAMLLYVSLSLGYFRKRSLFISSRVLLAIGGVAIVCLSAGAGAGLCAYFGVKATLIISEVIPFLVLAIGVDNIYILTNAVDLTSPTMDLSARIGLAVEMVGPSVLCAALCETCAFLTGSLTKMPAVQAFALYAGAAVIFDMLLQFLVFVPLLALDTKRQSARRFDIFPCFSSQSVERTPLLVAQEPDTEVTRIGSKNSYEIESAGRLGSRHSSAHSSIVRNFFAGSVSRFVLNPRSKVVILLIAGSIMCVSVAFAPQVLVGLDQSIALPRDSYLNKYFDWMNEYLQAGPNVYWVVKSPTDYADARVQNEICSAPSCSNRSLSNFVHSYASVSNVSYISSAPMLDWLQDYFTWLQTQPSSTCCRRGTLTSTATSEEEKIWVAQYCQNGSCFCPPCADETCGPQPPRGIVDCTSPSKCLSPSSGSGSAFVRPSSSEYGMFLPWFLGSACSTACGVCGNIHASDVELKCPTDTNGTVTHQCSVGASRFMSYNTVLRTQQDFIGALRMSYDLADAISKATGLDVISYSVFHVFFEQYLTIWSVACISLGLAAAAVCIVVLILIRSFIITGLILFCCGGVVAGLFFVMVFFNISLNAVSAVNLVVAIGISVEFCVHIAHAFMHANGNRDRRVQTALANVGAAVCSGIALTKFIGVVVLAFSPSAIFTVYYFRMYLAIVFLATLFGMLVLPVLLSLVGPPSKS